MLTIGPRVRSCAAQYLELVGGSLLIWIWLGLPLILTTPAFDPYEKAAVAVAC